MRAATFGLDAPRSTPVYTTQRNGAGVKPSVFGAFVIGVISLTLCVGAEARRIVIDLSGQRVFLLEGNQILLCSPIASGKPGWNTPTGSFRIRAKHINHRSRSFCLIEDSNGRVC